MVFFGNLIKESICLYFLYCAELNSRVANGHKLCKKAGGGQSRHVRSTGDTVTIAENGGSDVQPTRVY